MDSDSDEVKEGLDVEEELDFVDRHEEQLLALSAALDKPDVQVQKRGARPRFAGEDSGPDYAAHGSLRRVRDSVLRAIPNCAEPEAGVRGGSGDGGGGGRGREAAAGGSH